MQNYKNLSYTIRAKFAKTPGGTPTGEKWNENLSLIKLPDNAAPEMFSETYLTIINSFKNLLNESSYAPEDQEAIMGAITLNNISQLIAEDPTAGITTGDDTVNFALTLKMYDQTANKMTGKIAGYWTGNFDSDTVPTLDTFARALTNLSTNIYEDVAITTTLNPLEEV